MSDLVTEIKRATAIRYAWTFIGTPYRWGGDDPMAGFDCSGFIVEILTAVGIVPHKYDATAGGLADRFRDRRIDKPRAGAFVVWYDAAGNATHTEFLIDEFHTIGASGGGSGTIDNAAAIAANAFVKIRPVGYRGSNYRIFDPFGGAQ
jgi:cell wall-associated NlpC family hydrolase